MTQKQRTLLALLGLIMAAVLPVFCSPASADDGWLLRAGGVWIDPDGEIRQTVDGDRVSTRGDEDFGLGVTLERRFGERLGFEFGVPLISDPEVGVVVDEGDGNIGADTSLAMVALTAGLNLHLTPGRRADVYVGPFAGMVLLEDLSFSTAGESARFVVDDEFTYGAVLGVDLPVTERWGVCAAARYLVLDIDPVGDDGSSAKVGFDSLALAAGVSVRF